MSTTYKTLYQKVLLRLKTLDGRVLLISKDCVNDAMKVLCRIQDFDELKVWDTSQVTVASQKNYTIGTNWILTRPKDILSIKLMDTSNSRKLEYKSPVQLDEEIPYPQDLGEQRPSYYSQRGNVVELIPIPDAVYSLYIYHTQWPLELSADIDAMSLPDDLVDVIVQLAADMANSIIEHKGITDWTSRAKDLLKGSVMEELNRPDRKFTAEPFDPGRVTYSGEYWKQPFVKEVV